MKLLLLCLGLSLVCAHSQRRRKVVTNNIDVRKISGEWYTILLASNVRELIEENGVMRAFLNSVTVLHNSSLSMKVHFKIDGDCVPVILIANRTAENGVYKIRYPNMDTFHMIEAVYDDYLITHFYNTDSENTYFEFALYARTPDESSTIKKHFARIAQMYGIPKDNILDLTQKDRCLQARGNQTAQDSSAK